MVVWSALGRNALGIGLSKISPRHLINQNGICIKYMSSHRTFKIEPSRWQWHKCKDLLHLYVMVAAIPLGLVSLYANIFIGPAQLAPIPEGYEPKEWEYYKHPITRFFVKYLMISEQQAYEKHCHQLYEDYDLAEINRIESEVKSLQSKRHDYQHWFYVPVEKKFVQVVQEDKLGIETTGDKGYPVYP